jgi:hypothetical protein
VSKNFIHFVLIIMLAQNPAQEKGQGNSNRLRGKLNVLSK